MSKVEQVQVNIEENDSIIVEMKKIRELDESIRELELKIKMEDEELSRFQLENRKALKEMLMLASPERGSLKQNTKKFLDLYKNDDKSEDEVILNVTDEQKEKIEGLLDSPDEEKSPYFIDEDTRILLSKNYN